MVAQSESPVEWMNRIDTLRSRLGKDGVQDCQTPCCDWTLERARQELC
jgi:hypothetical protein